MYAIVEISGQQFKVEKDQEIFVHRQKGETGSNLHFDRVLLIENDGKVTVGAPTVKDAVVQAKIVEHMKGDKVRVFKKKRRKGYQKENGHRQYFSKIWIEDILAETPAKTEKKKSRKEQAPADEVLPPEAIQDAVKEEVAEESKPE